MFLLRRIASPARAEPDGLLRLQGIEELLEQGHFLRAYEEAERVLADGKNEERCLLVLGGAAYGLRKWELSVRHYEELRHAFPSNVDAQDGLVAALTRLAEERTGKYDFAKLYEAARRGETDVDVADYVGPIQVVDIPLKGKGIVASRDVKKGTLLLVSKAFAMSDISLPHSALATAIDEKLAREPGRIAEIAALYYGRQRDAATSTQDSDSLSVTSPDRLSLVCWYNNFLAEVFDGVPPEGFVETHRGLWILPSFFNHSCLMNVHRIFYGDIMTAFAVVDVKHGEELTLGYTSLKHPYELRAERLLEDYGVVCDCRLCELDRADPLCREHEELAREVIEVWTKCRGEKAIPTFTRLVNQIRETYVSRSELKTQLYRPLMALGHAHKENGEYAKAVEYLLEAVKCTPESLMPVWGVWAYAPIAVCCVSMRRPRTARRYARMAADLHRIRSGHDDALFKKTHRSIAHLISAEVSR